MQKCCLDIWAHHSDHSRRGLATSVQPPTAGLRLSTSSPHQEVSASVVLGVSALSFCMLFRVRSRQGAEEYTRTWSCGWAEPLLWRTQSLGAVHPCPDCSLSHHSLADLSIVTSCVFLLACHRAGLLLWTPMAGQGPQKHLLAAPENRAFQRSGDKSSASDGKILFYVECKLILEGLTFAC